MERVLLVTIKVRTERSDWSIEDTASELEELVFSAGAEPIDNITVAIDNPKPNLFIGKGKAEEIAVLCLEQNIDTVIFSHDLSGRHQRNLEEVIGRKTIDRTQLILDIFSRRAHTPEGRLQVELAQLQYLLPRLTGKGIILSRMGGGIGARGPGEQKLEVDRRRIRKRIDTVRQELANSVKHRDLMRKKRMENKIPSIALVGYTNAGKSTLLNALTGAGQVVKDQMFTTLDPLSKFLSLPSGENVVISDTVGFLHDLPHHLIDAFRATLEEVTQADLLLHVIDAGHANVKQRCDSVRAVLKELDAQDKQTITVLNKIDTLNNPFILEELKKDLPNSVAVSALNKLNLEELLGRISALFSNRMIKLKLLLGHDQMDLLAFFYKEGKVEDIQYIQEGVQIKLTIPQILYNKALKNKKIKIIN